MDCMDIADGDLNKEYQCVETAAKSFITEIGFLIKLQNDPNVPKLFAYCIPFDFIAHAELLASATVSGKPLDIIHLTTSDWSERVRILDEIIRFLTRSRPLLFRDFRRQQFVLIKNQPSMVDFDDVISTNNLTDHEPIVQKLYISFIDQILFATSPLKAQKSLAAIKEAYSNSTLTFENLSKITKKLRSL
uniref:Uncharacterized protein n=1 Tax=Panagrolaimus superbus TaxID=310955 RepID=A0A914Y2Q5_9BILA